MNSTDKHSFGAHYSTVTSTLSIAMEIKELAEKSITLLGNASLTEFVVQAIQEKATRVLTEANAITLSSQQFDAFMTTCENPGKPGKQLLDVAKSFDNAGYK